MSTMKYLRRFALIGGYPFAILTGLFALAIAAGCLRVGWGDLWTTPDQRGRRLFEHQKYDQAADAFLDPMWRGAALMRAGSFKRRDRGLRRHGHGGGRL